MQTQRVVVFESFNHTAVPCRDVPSRSASLKACFINVVQSELRQHSGAGKGREAGGVGGWGHCSLQSKWAGAETMAMKKTWQCCEKQHTSINFSRRTVQKGARESGCGEKRHGGGGGVGVGGLREKSMWKCASRLSYSRCSVQRTVHHRVIFIHTFIKNEPVRSLLSVPTPGVPQKTLLILCLYFKDHYFVSMELSRSLYGLSLLSPPSA